MMLTLDGVGKRFGQGPLLFKPLTAHCGPGMCVAVRGPHGAGKSTLLRIIAGLVTPSVGTVLFDGSPCTAPAWGPSVSLLLPEHPLFASRTVFENLVLSQQLAGHLRSIAVTAAYQVLQRLDLVAVADRPPEALSRSQHQLACVARAVVRRPRLLIADEPGEGLRPEAAAAAHALLAEAVVQGACLVMASTGNDTAAPTPTVVLSLDPPAGEPCAP